MHKRRAGQIAVVIGGMLLVLAACTPWPLAELPLDPGAWGPTPTPTPVVLVGAGDIARCRANGDEQTARLLDGIPGTVFTLGDNVYNDGTAQEFQECYAPTWGRHRERTRPAAGNHDYETAGARGYFDYFGARAGAPAQGYYSYDLGAWHIVVVNSNCGEVDGCSAGSPQGQWLRADLAAHPAACTLAYWHHPLFSGGKHGGTSRLRPVWQALYEAGAEVVLAGHDHNYQRYAPQDPQGRADPERGLRQFVVGTGGADLYKLEEVLPNLEVANDDTYGVLKLALRADGYDWEFLPVEGGGFTDAGSATCH
jgi:hypothetical protein